MAIVEIMHWPLGKIRSEPQSKLIFARVLIGSIFFTLQGACVSAPGKMAVLMSYEIKPNQTILVLEHFNVMHEGYGHRVTKAGDRSFFSLLISLKEKPGERASIRVYLPVDPLQSYEWNGLRLNVLSCEDQGPPHDQNAKVRFTASGLLKH